MPTKLTQSQGCKNRIKISLSGFSPNKKQSVQFIKQLRKDNYTKKLKETKGGYEKDMENTKKCHESTN